MPDRVSRLERTGARTVAFDTQTSRRVDNPSRQSTGKEARGEAHQTIAPDASLTDAATIMLREKIGCLVVVQAEKIVGILTESDFVKLAVRP